MSAIKPGDVALVIKPLPCCGSIKHLGSPVEIKRLAAWGRCKSCKHVYRPGEGWMTNRGCFLHEQLLKIEPPSAGETREAYRNLKVPA